MVPLFTEIPKKFVGRGSGHLGAATTEDPISSYPL
jgi:hypothetical protein